MVFEGLGLGLSRQVGRWVHLVQTMRAVWEGSDASMPADARTHALVVVCLRDMA